MLDEEIRALERRAEGGDEDAADRLIQELMRAGKIRFWLVHPPAPERPSRRSIPLPTTGEWLTPILRIEELAAAVESAGWQGVKLHDSEKKMTTGGIQDERSIIRLGGTLGTNTYVPGLTNVPGMAYAPGTFTITAGQGIVDQGAYAGQAVVGVAGNGITWDGPALGGVTRLGNIQLAAGAVSAGSVSITSGAGGATSGAAGAITLADASGAGATFQGIGPAMTMNTASNGGTTFVSK